MKTKNLKRLYKSYLSEALPNFRVKGHLVYHEKVEYLLRGFCFESSAFTASDFNIYVFVQPLYIPVPNLWFSFGHRIGELSSKGVDIWWTISDENETEVMEEVVDLIKGPGLDFLIKIQNPQDLINKYRINIFNLSYSYHISEAVAYSFILMEDYGRSKKILAAIKSRLKLEVMIKPKIPWLKDILGRVELVKALIDQENNNAATEQLIVWRDFTLEALKIPHVSIVGRSF